MKSLSYDSHNSNNNPHKQYDNSIGFRADHGVPNNGTDGFQYIKVAEFTLADSIEPFSFFESFNVVKSLSLILIAKDEKTEGNMYPISIVGEFKVSGNFPKNPVVRLTQSPLDHYNDIGISYFKVLARVTNITDKTPKSGVVPIKVELFISTANYGSVYVYPHMLITEGKTDGMWMPLGALNTDNSTVQQKFNDIKSDESGAYYTESALNNTLSSNQYIVNSTKKMSQKDISELKAGDDINMLQEYPGVERWYFSDKQNIVNSPFPTSQQVLFKVSTPHKGFVLQEAISDNNIYRRRVIINAEGSSWVGTNE